MILTYKLWSWYVYEKRKKWWKNIKFKYKRVSEKYDIKKKKRGLYFDKKHWLLTLKEI